MQRHTQRRNDASTSPWNGGGDWDQQQVGGSAEHAQHRSGGQPNDGGYGYQDQGLPYDQGYRQQRNWEQGQQGRQNSGNQGDYGSGFYGQPSSGWNSPGAGQYGALHSREMERDRQREDPYGAGEYGGWQGDAAQGHPGQRYGEPGPHTSGISGGVGQGYERQRAQQPPYGSGYGHDYGQQYGSQQGFGGRQQSGQGFGGQSYGQSRGHQGGYGESQGYGQSQGYAGSSGEAYGQSYGAGASRDWGYGQRSGQGGAGSGGSWGSDRGGQSSSRQHHYGKGPKDYRRSDDRIREEINDALMSSWELDPSDIEVKVENGEVTLTGTVASRNDKAHAEQLVESVLGVEDVINQLRRRRDSDRGVSGGERGSDRSANSGSASKQEGKQEANTGSGSSAASASGKQRNGAPADASSGDASQKPSRIGGSKS